MFGLLRDCMTDAARRQADVAAAAAAAGKPECAAAAAALDGGMPAQSYMPREVGFAAEIGVGICASVCLLNVAKQAAVAAVALHGGMSVQSPLHREVGCAVNRICKCHGEIHTIHRMSAILWSLCACGTADIDFCQAACRWLALAGRPDVHPVSEH